MIRKTIDDAIKFGIEAERLSRQLVGSSNTLTSSEESDSTKRCTVKSLGAYRRAIRHIESVARKNYGGLESADRVLSEMRKRYECLVEDVERYKHFKQRATG